ncbi:hypothetical protein G6F65_016210 [Rhizopus arrhizus]|nr:hypothetical protein G6F65_016210 [Rhizopus arrhizus]
MLFRYYDPRVWSALTWILSTSQLDALLGPVQSWTAPSAKRDIWRTYESRGTGNDGLPLAPGQMHAISSLASINRVIDRLLRVDHGIDDHSVSKQVYDEILSADALGLSDADDQEAFAFVSITQPPGIHEAPMYQEAIRIARLEPGAYRSIVTAALEDDESEPPLKQQDQGVGLPILPLRYAISRTDVKEMWQGPALGGAFGKDVTSIALPPNEARYTLRLARQGYLYVFNEVRGEWKGYQITSDSYLLEFDPYAAPPPLEEFQPTCARMADSQVARFVTNPDPKRAGKVWFGFTEAPWPKEILERNRRSGERKKHMRCVDVQAWLKGKALDHAGSKNPRAAGGDEPSVAAGHACATS